MKVKVCGMKDEDNINQIATYLPDYMGFIFYKASPRYVNGLNPHVVKMLPKSIKKVGVFVNEDPSKIIEAADTYQLQYIQLHGMESVATCEYLAGFNFKIIKAFNIGTEADLEKVNDYAASCHAFLFDSKTEKPGGSGIKFDWRLLKNKTFARPIFLSGGISPADINTIKALDIAIHAIDLNSKVELSPGIKDIKKLEKFILQLT